MKRFGVCRICHCTDEEGCSEGCTWENEDRTLCSSLACVLADALEQLEGYASFTGDGFPRLTEARKVARRLVRVAKQELRVGHG
jgi:hypothetical protein